MSQQTLDLIRALVVEQFPSVPLADVTLEARLIEDFGCDDLDWIELVVRVEETFGIVISDDARIESVADILAVVESTRGVGH